MPRTSTPRWPPAAAAAARDRFVLDHRPPRPRHDPWRHHGLSVEDERDADGTPARVATVFLTGRECPWRCVMCDLWQYTIDEDTPRGAIPAQIADARRILRAETRAREAARGDRDEAPRSMRDGSRASIPTAGGRSSADGGPGAAISVMKLYNAGSFFDPRAVPEDDYDAIAAQLSGLTRAIVESHPALVGPRVDRFLAALESNAGRNARRNAGGNSAGNTGMNPAGVTRPPRLEVAMGLETAHPDALERLHKRFTLDQFARAAAALRQRDVDLRVFLLIAPPFVPAGAQDEWLLRSVDAAFACGASVVSLVPTRPGNGALDALAAEGLFHPPRLADIERGAAAAIAHAGGRGRLFVDLWDLGRFADCPACLDARRARLHTMNLTQRVPGDADGEDDGEDDGDEDEDSRRACATCGARGAGWSRNVMR